MAFRDSRLTVAHVLPVLFMVWIILTIWVSYICLHLLNLLQADVPADKVDDAKLHRGLVELFISQTLMVLLCISFARAVWTNPGSVPATSEWKPSQPMPAMKWSSTTAGGLATQSETAPAALKEVKSKNGERRWCKHCKQWKPDRCHHCRVCKSCILRMDHHCPWIANCVGYRNFKFFFLLVLYAGLNAAFVVCTMVESLWESMEHTEMSALTRFSMVFSLTLAFIMSVLLLAFLTFHCWLISNGMTTIEFCETRHKVSGSGSMVSYNFGVFKNIQNVLGSNPLFWLLPIFGPEGDGLLYRSPSDKDGNDSSDPLMMYADDSGGFGSCGSQDVPQKAGKKWEEPPPEVTGERGASS